MEDLSSTRNLLKQTLDDDFSDAVLEIIQKHLERLHNESSDVEVENMVFRAVVTSETFNTLQNNLCIDISRNRLSRHASYGLYHEKEVCTCRLGLHSVIYAEPSYEIRVNDVIDTILESLLCSSLTCKLQMLDTLINLVSMEQISISNWKQFESGLQECLHHPVSVISEASMNVYVGAMCSSSPHILKESYSCLLNVISQLLSDDLKLALTYNIVNIINNFQTNISKHWLRYPEEVIKSLVEETFEYFCSCSTSDLLFTLYGILDPCSIWIRNWLYCKPSRLIIFQILSKHRHLLIDFVNSCCTFVADKVKNERKALQTSHNVSLLMNLASYKEGMKLITKVMEELNESVDLWTFLIDVTICVGRPALNEHFEHVFQNIFLMSENNNETCLKIAVMLDKLTFEDNPTKLILLSRCLERMLSVRKLICNSEIFQKIKDFIASASALKQ